MKLVMMFVFWAMMRFLFSTLTLETMESISASKCTVEKSFLVTGKANFGPKARNFLIGTSIVSSINAPNCGISQLVTEILTKAYNKENRYFIKDSFELARTFQNHPIPEDHVLISLDVTSLFTNIPRDLVKEIVQDKWHSIQQHTKIPLQDFLCLIDFIFDTVFFIFDNEYYKQIFGTPMGASVSPILAQYVMDQLLVHEKTIIPGSSD